MDAFAASRGSLGTLFSSLPSVAAAVIAFLLAASGPRGAQSPFLCFDPQNGWGSPVSLTPFSQLAR